MRFERLTWRRCLLLNLRLCAGFVKFTLHHGATAGARRIVAQWMGMHSRIELIWQNLIEMTLDETCGRT
jgi:hypothetical protein